VPLRPLLFFYDATLLSNKDQQNAIKTSENESVKGVIWECNNRIKTVSEKPPQRAAFPILLMHILSSADNK
jgi:hypothetical protein